MTHMTEFQSRAFALGVVNLFRKKHFSICDFDNLLELSGRKNECTKADRNSLALLHCVEWSDMGKDLTTATREKCLEILGLPPETIDMVVEKPASPKETPAEPARRLRLAFWRS